MSELFNMMKAAAAAVASAQGQPRWGSVINIDAPRGAVRVLMQPENVLSGWLPLALQSAGAGMTMLTVPTVGSQAFVIPDTGDAEHGVVVGFAHNDGAQVPKAPAVNGTGGTPSTTMAPLTPGNDGTVIRFGGAPKSCAVARVACCPRRSRRRSRTFSAGMASSRPGMGANASSATAICRSVRY